MQSQSRSIKRRMCHHQGTDGVHLYLEFFLLYCEAKLTLAQAGKKVHTL